MIANKRPETTLENGVGVVHVSGKLISNATPLDLALGATDYFQIINDCENLIEAGAKAIVFVFASGGGQVSGCIEVAEYIESLEIPTVGFVNTMSASAAYKIASSCNWIVSNKSAQSGSIGTILVLMDTSRAMNAAGLEYVCFTSEGATLKSTGHLDSLTPEQSKFLQSTINEMGEAFRNHVLKHREGVSPDVFKAWAYSGIKALELNLVDESGSMKTAIERANILLDLTNP